jgi:hypothetical protein
MKAGLAMVFLISSAFSQATYVSTDNALSAGFAYGRYNAEDKFGFSCSYALMGFLEASFTRTWIPDMNIRNFQHEYFLKLYGPKKSRFFISAGIGYLHRELRTELWRDFPLLITTRGIALEAGVHLVAQEAASRRVILSLFYAYLKPTEELRTPTSRGINSGLARSVQFDAGVAYHLGNLSLIIGPTLALDSDFENVFFGLHAGAMVRH